MRKVAEIGEIDAELDDVCQRAAGRLGDGPEVFEDPLDLPLDRPVHQLHGGGIQRDLAREVDGLAGLNRL